MHVLIYKKFELKGKLEIERELYDAGWKYFFPKGYILKPSKRKSPSELNKAFLFWRGSKSQVFEHFFKGSK